MNQKSSIIGLFISLCAIDASCRELICPMQVEVNFNIKNIPTSFDIDVKARLEKLKVMSLSDGRPIQLSVLKPNKYKNNSSTYTLNGIESYLSCEYQSVNIVTKLGNPKTCVLTRNKTVCTY